MTPEQLDEFRRLYAEVVRTARRHEVAVSECQLFERRLNVDAPPGHQYDVHGDGALVTVEKLTKPPGQK